MNPTRKQLEEIKMGIRPMLFRTGFVAVPNAKDVKELTEYEVRKLDKALIKKMTKDEILNLVAYGQSYLEQYLTGKFLYRKGLGRMDMADFDEAEAYNDIKVSLVLLKEELSRRPIIKTNQ